MAAGIFSREERLFINGGILLDFRTDGRCCNDYRHLRVNTGIISSANGSAEIELGKTRAMVGIKAELAEPEVLSPNIGLIHFFVECTANASPSFEGKGGDDVALELSNGLAEILNEKTLDLESLCIVPGKHCWSLFVDAVVLECDGNLFDALSLAVKAALSNTLLPTLLVSGDSDDVDIEVSDDHYDVKPIDASRVPVMVTVNKIGNNFILDATLEEESCVDARLLVAVNHSGQICRLRKYGNGGLDPSLAFEMIEVAKEAGISLNRTLEKATAANDMT